MALSKMRRSQGSGTPPPATQVPKRSQPNKVAPQQARTILQRYGATLAYGSNFNMDCTSLGITKPRAIHPFGQSSSNGASSLTGDIPLPSNSSLMTGEFRQKPAGCLPHRSTSHAPLTSRIPKRPAVPHPSLSRRDLRAEGRAVDRALPSIPGRGRRHGSRHEEKPRQRQDGKRAPHRVAWPGPAPPRATR